MHYVVNQVIKLYQPWEWLPLGKEHKLIMQRTRRYKNKILRVAQCLQQPYWGPRPKTRNFHSSTAIWDPRPKFQDPHLLGDRLECWWSQFGVMCSHQENTPTVAYFLDKNYSSILKDSYFYSCQFSIFNNNKYHDLQRVSQSE